MYVKHTACCVRSFAHLSPLAQLLVRTLVILRDSVRKTPCSLLWIVLPSLYKPQRLPLHYWAPFSLTHPWQPSQRQTQLEHGCTVCVTTATVTSEPLISLLFPLCSHYLVSCEESSFMYVLTCTLVDASSCLGVSNCSGLQGVCVSYETCLCQPGYQGDSCEQRTITRTH